MITEARPLFERLTAEFDQAFQTGIGVHEASRALDAAYTRELNVLMSQPLPDYTKLRPSGY
ncbi:MAG: hypothetical protein US86_C0001G0429 [Candidatus Daviesbacteria bacterium GW2011_GWA2_38_24]|uniref:Uncharacterized protein n=1 Tax=Candidatus Daviesbacteria bacterium GW2011_GWA2_38_24 TaxID=1618422 RepID=A0A0G0JKV7_9BACT|nr:MAG: hypothetical protein US86_C0001G0429 [Candidatus Daviesbacteria bacterium GW2011_GWA2_38_24]KKQ79201.1 MAG: hypothetical protein UT01_C0047G0002 [Candidatus Daviesbacteria bacterium GW2011_GWA1_38_7]